MKYTFDFGEGGEVDYELALDEKDIMLMLYAGGYKMNIHMHSDHYWLWVELFKEDREGKLMRCYSMCVDGEKASYDFIVRFGTATNVGLCSDYEPEVVKQVRDIDFDFKESKFDKLQKNEMVTLNLKSEKVKKEKNKKKAEYKTPDMKPDFVDDLPF